MLALYMKLSAQSHSFPGSAAKGWPKKGVGQLAPTPHLVAVLMSNIRADSSPSRWTNFLISFRKLMHSIVI
jgi:hypothetical protein